MTPRITTELDEFRRRGWVVLRSVLSPDEAAHLAIVLGEYVAAVAGQRSNSLDSKGFGRSREGNGGIDSDPTDAGTASSAAAGDANPAYNLEDAPDEVAAFITSERFGRIAAEFLGSDAVRILHFGGMFKPSGGPQTHLHQDLSYIPLATGTVVSLWFALSDISPETSPLIYADGSHVLGAQDVLEAARRFPMVRACPMKAGDIAVHGGWVVHGALKNTSAQTRKAFGICYYADGARIEIREQGSFVQGLLNSCFAGLRTGDLAVSPANPVVYGRSPAERIEETS